MSNASEAIQAARRLGYPVVAKGEGLAHKSDHQAVFLNLRDEAELTTAVARLTTESVLIERMVEGAIVELSVGINHDPAHGFVLMLAAGGVHIEILNDRQHLLLPASAEEIGRAISKLRLAPLLDGYRGGRAVDRRMLVDAIVAVQDCVLAHAHKIQELEINPLLCCENQIVAADALVRMET